MKYLLAAIVCTGCCAPSTSFVADMRKTHDLSAHVFQTFEMDHPDQAATAKLLFNSEEALIQREESTTRPAQP